MKDKKKLAFEDKKNKELALVQLERRKEVYKAINRYILSLKVSRDTASEKEEKEIKKLIKELAEEQEKFS